MKDIQFSKFYILFLQIGLLLNFSCGASIDKDDKDAKQSKCSLVAKNLDELKENVDSCFKRLNLDPSKFKEDEDEDALKELEKSGFDDKCLGKCIAEKYNMLSPDGHFNKAAYSEYLERFNGSAELKKIINNFYLTCAEKVEMKAKEEGGMKGNECKYMGMFRHCMGLEGFKKKDEIQALCQTS